jgi:hypothetical protein
MDLTISALNEAALEIGKATIYYAAEWDGATNLTLAHLGDTEGAVSFNAQESIGGLKLPEHYNEAYIRAYVTGADPVLTAPLFLADPTLRDLISPTGDGLIGTGTRREVTRYTLVIMPAALHYDPDTGRNTATISFDGTAWEKVTEAAPTGRVLTEDEERLLGLSIFIFSGYWERPAVTYEATVNDVVKNIEECTFHGMRPTADALNGIIAVIGMPSYYDIDIAPES